MSALDRRPPLAFPLEGEQAPLPLGPDRVLAEAGELRQPDAGWGHLLGQCVLDLAVDLAL